MASQPDSGQFDYSNGTFDRNEKPLWTRAWVFQETVLAPRTLNYDSNMLYWECHQLRAWETKPGGLTGFKSVKTHMGEIKMLGERANAEPDSEFAREARIKWSKIVYSYTRGDLTWGKDKLVALSGIASRTQLYTGWRYLAGLWEPNILHHLFWYNKGHSPNKSTRLPGTRPRDYRAPSWSWASVDGDVDWYHPVVDYKRQAEVIEVHVDLVDPAYPFGEVSGGVLRIRGSLQLDYKRKPKTPGFRMAGTEFQFPSGGDLIIYQDTKCPCEAQCEVCGEGISFLLLGTYEKAPASPLKRHVNAQIGLVLCQEKGKEGCFRRIGFFLEHLREKNSSFPGYSKLREVVII